MPITLKNLALLTIFLAKNRY